MTQTVLIEAEKIVLIEYFLFFFTIKPTGWKKAVGKCILESFVDYLIINSFWRLSNGENAECFGKISASSSSGLELKYGGYK